MRRLETNVIRKKTCSSPRRRPLLACGLVVSLSVFCAATAQGGGGGAHGGGGGGGSHFSGGGGHVGGGGHFAGGSHVGGGYAHYQGGGYGGGWRGGWRGYHGGWSRYGGGFGAGLGLGLYFAALPAYYSTYWWGGIPYYYADATFYAWDGSAGQYETVSPPPEVEQQAQSEASQSESEAGQSEAGAELIAYPTKGQSDQQQTQDKSECRQWAQTQSGYDPAGATANADSDRENYLRAQAACLDARGYSVS
jgi:hypothetical protein